MIRLIYEKYTDTRMYMHIKHIHAHAPGPLHRIRSGRSRKTRPIEASKAYTVVNGVVSQDCPTERERGTVSVASGRRRAPAAVAVLTIPSLRASDCGRVGVRSGMGWDGESHYPPECQRQTPVETRDRVDAHPHGRRRRGGTAPDRARGAW